MRIFIAHQTIGIAEDKAKARLMKVSLLQLGNVKSKFKIA